MNFHLLLDAQGCIIHVSSAFENWLGKQFAELENTSITELIRSAHMRELKRFFQKFSTETFELNRAVFTAPDGSFKWADMVFSYLPQFAVASQIMVSIHAIDEQFVTGRAGFSATHTSFFEKHPFGVLHLDTQGTVINTNQQIQADSGFKLDDLKNGNLIDFVASKNRFEILRGFIKAAKQGQSSSLDIQVKTDQQELLYVNFTIVPVVYNGQTIELYTIVKNIAEHIQLQQNLKKLSIVADKATNGVAVLDTDFSIELVNDGFLQMTGYKHDQLIGKRLSDLITREDVDAKALDDGRENLLKGIALEREMECFRPDGTSYWNLIRLTPIMTDDGEMEMCITVHTDITDKKKAEMELRLLADDLYRQNKELHQFAYIVSHNMRSPVANIVGLANLLELFKDDPETQAQTLKELTKSVNNLDTVIKDLSYILTVNNASKELLKEPVILQDLLQQVLVDLQPQILVTDADITIAAKPLVMRTNRAYIYSIFYNLISNAIKYKSHQKPFIKIDFYMTDSHTVMYVADNGKGIDLEKHSHDMFKPYKRFDFKVEGKGLGLFLVKSHVEALGGSLTVKSEVNKGSTFYIKIPFA